MQHRTTEIRDQQVAKARQQATDIYDREIAPVISQIANDAGLTPEDVFELDQLEMDTRQEFTKALFRAIMKAGHLAEQARRRRFG